MLVTQMRDKIVPDRLGFRISADKNDGHLCVLSSASRCLYERASDGAEGHSPEVLLKWNWTLLICPIRALPSAAYRVLLVTGSARA